MRYRERHKVLQARISRRSLSLIDSNNEAASDFDGSSLSNKSTQSSVCCASLRGCVLSLISIYLIHPSVLCYLSSSLPFNYLILQSYSTRHKYAILEYSSRFERHSKSKLPLWLHLGIHTISHKPIQHQRFQPGLKST